MDVCKTPVELRNEITQTGDQTSIFNIPQAMRQTLLECETPELRGCEAQGFGPRSERDRGVSPGGERLTHRLSCGRGRVLSSEEMDGGGHFRHEAQKPWLGLAWVAKPKGLMPRAGLSLKLQEQRRL